MKKIQFLFLSLGILFGSLAFTACSSDSDDNGGGGGGGNTPLVDPEPGNMKFAKLYGLVNDGYNALSGVKVTSGTQTTTTRLDGTFTLDQYQEVNGRVVVKFEKDGYMSLTRSFPKGDVNKVVASLKSAETRTFSTGSKTTLTMNSYGEGGSMTMTVELPANYKNGSSAYTGTVTAKSTYLNPDNESFPTEMPGDLTTNSNGQLVSLGMVAVELTGSNGEKLQLADGETAKLSFPVPGNAKETPATMPLWSFNESTGLWEKEGDATYDATNKVYVGTVSHFSWHNLDYEMARATLNVKVVNSAGTALYDVPVDIDGQRKVYTNKDGIATCVVPSNTKLYVRVKSEDYGNYAMDYSSGPWGTYDESKEAKLTGVTLAGQETKTVELKINARAPRISGNIINEGSGSKVCTVYLTYGTMQQTEKVVSDLEGAFITYGPANYTGKGKVVALFGDGTLAEQEFDLDGTDKVVNVKVNTSSTGGAGIIQVTGVSESFKFNYSFTSAFKGQYYMDGSTLSFSATDMPENISKDVDPHTMSFHYIYFKIDNYEAGKSEYMLENFSIMREGHGGGHMNIEGSGEIKAAITQNGDSWTLKFSGVKANLNDEVRNISQAQITFDGELTSTVTKSSRE